MISLAFLNADESFKHDNLFDRFLNRSIVEATHGKYCHVEMWLEGPQNKAVCYSSRGGGTALATIDLTDSALWMIAPVKSLQLAAELAVYWFARGSCGKPYDAEGLVGIGIDAPLLHDNRDRFCSEAVFEALQTAGNMFPGIGPRWMVAPSGTPRGGFGLYELVTAA